MKKMLAVSLTVTLLGIANSLFAIDQSSKIAELERRIERLEKALNIKQNATSYSKKTAYNSKLSSYNSNKENVIQEKLKARKRMKEDWRRYSRKQRKEIEALYQSRGHKHGSAEKIENLKKVISKYSRANRAGCAILYLGQFNGDRKNNEYYLKKAINQYADCFYGDGVQVGAYSRYCLARVYLKEGKKDQANVLFKQIKAKYPNAIDHRGKSLASQIDIISSKENL